ELYGRPNRLTVPERSVQANLVEAMHMLAGAAYNEKLSSPTSRLQRLIHSGKDDREIVEEFYIAAFSRPIEPREWDTIRNLIAAGGEREEALKDFVWALLCSREFAENH